MTASSAVSDPTALVSGTPDATNAPNQTESHADSDSETTAPATHSKDQDQSGTGSPTIPPFTTSRLARVPSRLKAIPSAPSVPASPISPFAIDSSLAGSLPGQRHPSRRSNNNPARAARQAHLNHDMPKASSNPILPLNGLFPIAKPSGPPSMRLIDSITPLLLDSKLFYDPDRIHPTDKKKRKSNLTHMGLKIGQGGTLDPLADGVLVMGVNRGTKHLQQFLECTKEYESWGLLGAATTTYDSEGPVLSTHSFDGVTREDIEKALDQFRGTINQTPPIFSALKMEGKPLYEYARESKPLPRAIPVRQCQVSIELLDFKPASVAPADGGHEWRWPKEHLSDDEKEVFRRLTSLVEAAGTEVKTKGDASATAATVSATSDSTQSTDTNANPAQASHAHTESEALADGPHPEVSPSTGLRPAAFKVRMTVSSGTYVRSIVHDIGLALGCGAHVVTLTRTRQGQFTLHGDEEALEKSRKEAMSRWYAAHPADDPAAEQVAKPVVEVEEEMDEEAALNAMASTSTSASAPAPLPPKPDTAFTQTKARLPGQTVDYTSSTVSIPWSVFDKALADRKVMLDAERAEQAAAATTNEVGEGEHRRKLSPEQMKKYFSSDEVMKRRRARPLQEWEEYVLARFEEVPVPIGGAHGTARYR